jgi:hypothetical protein
MLWHVFLHLKASNCSLGDRSGVAERNDGFEVNSRAKGTSLRRNINRERTMK